MNERIAEEIEELGADRSGVDVAINNARIGDADSYQCPQGTFVSRLDSSGAVGGRYAIDGIARIIVRCSPIN